MLKHYISWQIRKWWPMLLIFSIILTVTALYTNAFTTMAVRYYDNGSEYVPYYSFSSTTSNMPSLFIVGLVLSLVMSLFVFSYRTRRQSVDVFYQAAYAPTTIKRVRLLIGLAILLLSMLIAFLLGTTVFLLRYVSTPAEEIKNNIKFVRISVHWGMYFLSFFLTFIFVGLHYLINCFLVSLGDYTFDQICLLIFGNIFLALCFTSPVIYFDAALMKHGVLNDYMWYPALYSLGPVGPVALVTTTMEQAIFQRDVAGDFAINAVVSSSIYALGGIGALAFNLFVPDPSGEHADQAGARNQAVAMIPHGAAAVLGMLMAALGLINDVSVLALSILPIFGFILFSVVYYALLALWRHSFRMKKFDLICYVSVVGGTLVMLTFAMAL